MWRILLGLVLIINLVACNSSSKSEDEVPNPNPPPANQVPVISNQALSVNINANLTITLGALTDADGDSVTYTISGTTHTSAGSAPNTVIYRTPTTGTETFNVQASDGKGGSASATISVTAGNSNNVPTIAAQNLTVAINTNLEITLGALTDVDGDTVVYAVQGTTKTTAGSAANKIVYRTGVSGTESFTATATDNKSDPVSATITVVANKPNTAPAINNQTLEVVIAQNRTIVLGALTDSDGDTVSYTVAPMTHVTLGSAANQIVYNNPAVGSENLTVTATDNINTAVNATIAITVKASESSNYITSRAIILPTYGASAPAKGESRTDPTTGIRLTRLTNVSDLTGTSDALIVYSRYSPESSDGKYFLAFAGNSTTAWAIDRENLNVVARLAYDDTGRADHTVGEFHEVRWDYSGNHPHRVYYRNNKQLWMIDDVANQSATRTLVKDFGSLLPSSSIIYNDVEGDSSDDSDHWAFMAAHYSGSNYVIDAYIHYQISTDTTHVFKPADLTGSGALATNYAGKANFPKPNMVEMSPNGDGVILHYGRAWVSGGQSVRAADIGTWFDGPHMWPNDFKWNTSAPVKVSIDESHSGWAFDAAGRQMFISQNNRTDHLDAIYTGGASSGYDNRLRLTTHGDFGWTNGFHYGKVPLSKKGWAFINTYASNGALSSEWGANQLIFMQVKDSGQNPKIWRIGSNYNQYAGDYRDEAPAAINTQGNRVYVSANWGGTLGHREIFVFHLPSNWEQAAPLQ